jgi:FkbM family methyltransferase
MKGPAVTANQDWGSARPQGLTKLAISALEWGIVRGALKRPLYRFIHRKWGALDIEFQGLKFRCYIDGNGPERFIILHKRRPLSPSLRLLLSILKPGDVFVDVGANFGLFSILAASKVGSTGRVIAIEPHPELYRRLCFNARINAFEQIAAFRTAVGEIVGEAVLHIARDSDLAKSSLSHSSNGQKNIIVPVTLLSNILTQASVPHVDALKVDVEGYEDRVLMPFMKSAPARLRPKWILIEVKHSTHWRIDCIAEMEKLGYLVSWRSDSDTLLQIQNP